MRLLIAAKLALLLLLLKHEPLFPWNVPKLRESDGDIKPAQFTFTSQAYVLKQSSLCIHFMAYTPVVLSDPLAHMKQQYFVQQFKLWPEEGSAWQPLCWNQHAGLHFLLWVCFQRNRLCNLDPFFSHICSNLPSALSQLQAKNWPSYVPAATVDARSHTAEERLRILPAFFWPLYFYANASLLSCSVV